MTWGTTLPGDGRRPGLLEETSEIDLGGTDEFRIAMTKQGRQERVKILLGVILFCHKTGSIRIG